MRDEDLKKLFESADEVEPSKDARSRAREAALEAFDEQKITSISQGNRDGDRLTPVNQIGRRTMTISRWVMSGVASAAVMVLAIALVMQIRLDTPTIPEDREQDVGARPVPSMTSSEDRVAGKPRDESARVRLPEPVASRETPSMATPDALRKSPQVRLPESATPREVPSMEMQKVRPTPTAARERKLEDIVVGRTYQAAPTESESFARQIVPQTMSRDKFPVVEKNGVKLTAEEPVSTFSIDVDTVSYSFVRKQLNQGVLPAKDAVRLEEMVNYFPYEYAGPDSRNTPFKATVSVMDSPWHETNKLVHIGIRGYELPAEELKRSNLVFLLDVSGSMNQPDKLPLVKQSMGLLLEQLQPEDTVAIVVYAGAAGLVLEPTPVKEKEKILAAMQRLQAGGSTAGAAGIKLAYATAMSNFVEGGVNRVILATDGDFNVGINSTEELKGFVERQRASGVFLSVLGFGQGNYQDQIMQTLAQNGNGVAAYIDSLSEAQKVLVDESTSTLFTIAKDVKIQMEFNPAAVKEYRLLGYETRLLNREDFNNDAVDAGEIGAGHTVTALYEITPVNADGLIDPLRYGQPSVDKEARPNEYGFLKIRYKLPDEDTSKLISQPVPVNQQSLSEVALREARFATAVAGFAQLLQGGEHTGDWSWDDALALAQENRGDDLFGYRAEFVQLIRKAKVADTTR